MVTVTIGGKKLAGFDQPIEMLKDCHRRIEHFLDVLKRIVHQYGDGALPKEGRRALEASLNYFADAAERHTADEEQSLFPRLRRSYDPGALLAMSELDRLEQQHRSAEACHARVEEIASQWLEIGRISHSDHITIRALLAELTTLYSAHIRLEDELIFVLASRLLKENELREIGREMRQRRLVTESRVLGRKLTCETFMGGLPVKTSYW